MSEGYNGWTNYETWNCALWLDNDPGAYEMWRERSQEFVNEAGSKDEANEVASRLGDEIQASIEESMPELDASMWADLMQASFGEINFREIAKHYIEDCDDPEPEDDELDLDPGTSEEL